MIYEITVSHCGIEAKKVQRARLDAARLLYAREVHSAVRYLGKLDTIQGVEAVRDAENAEFDCANGSAHITVIGPYTISLVRL